MYTSAESASQSSESIKLDAGDESRFQRWCPFHFTNPGAVPHAADESASIADPVLLPKIRSERATPLETLAKVLAGITPRLPYSITPSIAEALELARSRPNPILVTGSLHFAGEVLAYLRGEPAAFEECAQ